MMKKHFVSILLLLLIIMCISSCHKDNEEIIISPPVDDTGLLGDGQRISGINLYCIEKDRRSKEETLSYYYPKTKTIDDYSNMQLLIVINDDGYTYQSDDYEEMAAIQRLEFDYCRKKSSFIVEALEKYGKGKAAWPILFDAYTTGEVTLTCDKTLFGEEPGTNLSKYFNIFADNECMVVGVENPGLLYGFGEELPSLMSDYFPVSVWLQLQYMLTFQTYPTEKHEDFTLYLTIPMLIEHTRDYALSIYRGTPLSSPKRTEHTYTAECPIKFKWN